MRIILSLIFVLWNLALHAQQGPQLLMPAEDSIRDTAIDFALPTPLPATAAFNNTLLTNNLQAISFTDQLGNVPHFTLNEQALEMPQLTYIPASSLSYPSPFYYNAQIFGGSSTQLNDKITIGGFNYGTSSLLSAPLPKANNSYFDTYGSTLFMEYKVSKSIKIETRVSVGHSNRGPLPGY